jgi:hypothetical protein
MAIGENATPAGASPHPRVVPVSEQSDWSQVCDAPATADNAGSTVTNPGGITRAEQHWLPTAGRGTQVAICLKYPAGASISTQVVVQPFGRDSAGIPQALLDAAGGNALTLTASATDATDGTWKYTAPVYVDALGSKDVLVAVKTALAGSTITGAVILARNV